MISLADMRVFLIFFVIALNGCGEKDTLNNNDRYLINDSFSMLDNLVWQSADGWSNGSPFLNGWCAENISFTSSGLQINLENRPCSNEAYASGEYRTQDLFGYGRIEVEMKAAQGSGVVSSLFFYTGESDNGNAHEEIDIEILGVNSNAMQVNYWTEEFGIEKEHPTFIELGFDASLEYHLYAIEWRDESIKWYVDNKLVHTENGDKGPLPKLDMRLFINLWPCSADTWCGSFDDTILPVNANYRNFKYNKY